MQLDGMKFVKPSNALAFFLYRQIRIIQLMHLQHAMARDMGNFIWLQACGGT
jgi:hypothetical protein